MTTLEELKNQKEALRTELEMRVIKEQIDGLKGLRESWSAADEDWSVRDSLSPTGSSRAPSVLARRGDWQDGAYPPYYYQETDIQRMLANVRNLATFDSIYGGVAEALNSYTLGGEWAWKVEAIHPQCPPELVGQVQRELDKFLEYNDWIGELDSEIHDVSREDGEVLVGLYAEGKENVICKYTESEFITEPLAKRDLDYYCGTEDAQTAWWFGVHIVWNDVLKTWNWERPLGYHVCYDDQGNHWDYLPLEPRMRLDEDIRCAVHIKRNVPRRALRGISDYWPVWQDMEANFKLYKGTRDGATLQSYIAYIIQHAEGATRENVSQSLDDDPLWQYTAQRNAASGRRQRRMAPGQIIHVDEGQQYQASPMGSMNQPVFIEVGAAGLRRLAVRWNMPEYLISGDASNSNYASTLSAGSPFVKSRQKDQAFYRRRYRTVMMRAMQIRCLQGAFGQPWEVIRQLVDIQPEAPDVDIQNILELTQRRQILNQAGVLDAQTWASLEELDPEKVTSAPQTPQEAPTGEMSTLGRRQWTNNTKAIDDVLQRLISGEASETKARALLGTLGLSDAKIDALILDAKDGVIDGAAESLRYKLAKELLWESYP